MHRSYCTDCQRPPPTCYCEWVSEVRTRTKFVILMHPDERRRRIATGRMSHLSLTNSELIIGEEFHDNPRVLEIIDQDDCYLLYPGQESRPCRELSSDRPRTIFVLDAKWAQSRKMLAASPALMSLPRISFAGGYESWFTIKRQPRSECLSTLEAILYTISELPDEQVETLPAGEL